MQWLLYIPARLIVALVQLLPLGLVARLGRMVGGCVYFFDKRHRNVAIKNITHAFGDEKSPEEIQALAKENFRRVGEAFGSAIKTMSMSKEQIAKVLDLSGIQPWLKAWEAEPERSRVFAIGHFGNFEIYASINHFLPGIQGVTTYRGLRQPMLNKLLSDLRGTSGTLFFERRTDARQLKKVMQTERALLGLLVDQHAGDRGLRMPFFGRECSVSTAPAVFALRYDCELHVAICYRTALGRWSVEVGDEIPTHENGEPRSSEAIMTEVNQQFETAIRRDPANWFWVHNRWKPAKKKKAPQKVAVATDSAASDASAPAEMEKK